MKIYGYFGSCNVCGQRLREIREKKRITQEQLSAKMQIEGVQITQKAISRIESGERVVADYELLVFSRVLSVSICCFLGED